MGTVQRHPSPPSVGCLCAWNRGRDIDGAVYVARERYLCRLRDCGLGASKPLEPRFAGAVSATHLILVWVALHNKRQRVSL